MPSLMGAFASRNSGTLSHLQSRHARDEPVNLRIYATGEVIQIGWNICFLRMATF